MKDLYRQASFSEFADLWVLVLLLENLWMNFGKIRKTCEIKFFKQLLGFLAVANCLHNIKAFFMLLLEYFEIPEIDRKRFNNSNFCLLMHVYTTHLKKYSICSLLILVKVLFVLTIQKKGPIQALPNIHH